MPTAAHTAHASGRWWGWWSVCARAGRGATVIREIMGGKELIHGFQTLGIFQGIFPIDICTYLLPFQIAWLQTGYVECTQASSIETQCCVHANIISKVTRYQPIHYPKPKPPQRNHTHSLTQDLRLLKISLSPPPPRARPSKRTFESTEPIIINNNNESTLG